MSGLPAPTFPPARDGRWALVPVLGDHTAEATASRVYLAALRTPHPTRELLLAQGIPPAVLDPALALLHARGLVHVGPQGSLDVPPPIATLPQHASDLERRAQELRSTAYELTQVFYNARTRERDPGNGLILLHDLDEVSAQTNALVAGAVEQISVSRAPTSRSVQVLAAPLESHREPTVGLDSRPVRHRTLWDTELLETPGTIEVLRARRTGGEEQRFLPRVPLSCVVVDGAACLVEWTTDPPGDEAAAVGLVVHTPGMVHGVMQVFERMWELASPVNRGTASGDIDRRDLTILRLMSAGVADASIARQTGVSQRTVERRIRSLMERLGAGTRFQAGVQAVRRGWL